MKNSIMKHVVAVMLMLSLVMGVGLVSYASETETQCVVGSIVDESVLLAPSVISSSSAESNERSSVLAQAACEIMNEGNGVASGRAETLCYQDVLWMCLTLYLERYDEETNSWDLWQDYYQEFEPDENGILHIAHYSFSEDVEPGYYYRVRCRHELEFADESGNIWYEAKVTKTNGIIITSTP